MYILCAVRDVRAALGVRRALEEKRLTVQIVTDGPAALREGEKTDILLIDAVLPGLDGLGVVDALRSRLGDRMPRLIGGAATPLAHEGFVRRGAHAVLHVPWDEAQMIGALRELMDQLAWRIDWEAAQATHERACALLREMGMRASLKGFEYLAWAAALCYEQEGRLFAIGAQVYRPIAQRFGTTEQSVERLIRHALERTMDMAQARGVYELLGNTIDPARGKPTNAQMTAMLVQRLRIAAMTREPT